MPPWCQLASCFNVWHLIRGYSCVSHCFSAPSDFVPGALLQMTARSPLLYLSLTSVSFGNPRLSYSYHAAPEWTSSRQTLAYIPTCRFYFSNWTDFLLTVIYQEENQLLVYELWSVRDRMHLLKSNALGSEMLIKKTWRDAQRNCLVKCRSKQVKKFSTYVESP